MRPRALASIRSLLIVAGDDRPAIDAGLLGAADALLVDLAFGSAQMRRGVARLVLRELSDQLGENTRKPIYVRIDVSGSGQALADLDAAILLKPDSVMAYRTASAADLHRLGSRLSVQEALHGLPDGATGIIATLDSAAAILKIAAAQDFSRRLVGVAWDSAPLGGALGSRWAVSDREPPEPLRLARSLCLYAAAAAGVPALDAFSPLINSEIFRAACIAARRDGFSGKLVVGADQVEIANEVFARP